VPSSYPVITTDPNYPSVGMGSIKFPQPPSILGRLVRPRSDFAPTRGFQGRKALTEVRMSPTPSEGTAPHGVDPRRFWPYESCRRLFSRARRGEKLPPPREGAPPRRRSDPRLATKIFDPSGLYNRKSGGTNIITVLVESEAVGGPLGAAACCRVIFFHPPLHPLLLPSCPFLSRPRLA